MDHMLPFTSRAGDVQVGDRRSVDVTQLTPLKVRQSPVAMNPWEYNDDISYFSYL